MAEPTIFHDDKVLEDAVVFLTGHVYRNCTFRRCTLVIHGMPVAINGGSIEHCIWHIDLVASEAAEFQEFLTQYGPMILESLPHV